MTGGDDAASWRVYTMRHLSAQTAKILDAVVARAVPALVSRHGRLVAMIRPLPGLVEFELLREASSEPWLVGLGRTAPDGTADTLSVEATLRQLTEAPVEDSGAQDTRGMRVATCASSISRPAQRGRRELRIAASGPHFASWPPPRGPVAVTPGSGESTPRPTRRLRPAELPRDALAGRRDEVRPAAADE